VSGHDWISALDSLNKKTIKYAIGRQGKSSSFLNLSTLSGDARAVKLNDVGACET
jgi:hypothetical protein